MTITVVGSLNYDLVTYTNRVPAAGETVLAVSFEKHLGGKGFNEAYACARLKLQPCNFVRMVGNVGSDAFGEELKNALAKVGVNTEYVHSIEGETTGVANITVERSGENRIMIVPGANGKMHLPDSAYEEIFRSQNSETPEFVMLQNEIPDVSLIIDRVKRFRSTIAVAYNPSPFIANLLDRELLRKIDLLIVNEGEALEIATELGIPNNSDGKTTIEYFCKLAETLQRCIGQQNIMTVIITLGAQGAVFVDHSHQHAQHMPAAPIEGNVVDTTGAGDTFFGGLVLQLRDKQPLETAVRFASVASSLAIQKRGAAESIPTHEEVVDRLSEL